MRSRIVATYIALLLAFVSQAQELTSRLTYNFGLGYTFMGKGDIVSTAFENNINYRISSLFSGSIELLYAKSPGTLKRNTSFIQEHVNFFVSPPSYDRRNDLKIGFGLTMLQITHFDSSKIWTNTGKSTQYEVVNGTRFGVNVVVEDMYALTDKYSLGLKFFLQGYENFGAISGALLKAGIKL